MPGQGYANWGRGVLLGGAYVAGQKLGGGELSLPLGWPVRPGPMAHRTVGGTHILQHVMIGGDCPMNVQATEFRGRITNDHLEDHELFLGLVARSATFGFMPNLLWTDEWHIPSANEGQTEWRTSRRLPYHLAGVTHLTHPAKVWIDGVEQVVLESGSPGAGEVVVPAAGAYEPIVTPTDLGGTYLTLSYHPEFEVLLELALDNPDHNLLVLDGVFTDHPGNTYTGYSG